MTGHPSDRRILLYRMARHAAIIVGVVFLVKVLFLDVIAVKGDQMAPVIVRGDRVLVVRTPFLPLLRAIAGPSRGRPVLFAVPFATKPAFLADLGFGNGLGCLRVAGLSGDTVSVTAGGFRNSADSTLAIPPRWAGKQRDPIPADFSPRDFYPAVRVPAPGDQFDLDSLDLCRLFSAIYVIRQENPSSIVTVRPLFSVDGKPTNDYFISDFALYHGPLDSVPYSNRFDWFFWKRIDAYLHMMNADHKAALSFAVELNGVTLRRYTVKKRYMFLSADNWSGGLDSRYYGPVAADWCFARPLAVLWSFKWTPGKKLGFAIGRIGKILK